MAELTRQQRNTLQEELAQQLARLKDDARQKMNPDARPDYNDMAGEVTDSADDAVTDVMIDTDNALAGQRMQQIADTEAALQRIQEGVYGICVQCGTDIAYERLAAYPTAQRCIACQSMYERTHAQGGRRTL